jgi:transcriptional regulator with XRE-family HTH domain
MAVALPNEVFFPNMDHPIGRWRHRHQVTQAQLAERCGLSQQAIAAYESGHRTPRGASLTKLIEATSIPLEALIFPEAYLRDHPDYLTEPPRQRRPRKRP